MLQELHKFDETENHYRTHSEFHFQKGQVMTNNEFSHYSRHIGRLPREKKGNYLHSIKKRIKF